jgi:hypothetical protein
MVIGILVLHIIEKKGFEKIEIFCKIEPYLTSLNVYQLERQVMIFKLR